jgi:hypothetical protein
MPDIDVKNDTGFPDFLISLHSFLKRRTHPFTPLKRGITQITIKKL